MKDKKEDVLDLEHQALIQNNEVKFIDHMSVKETNSSILVNEDIDLTLTSSKDEGDTYKWKTSPRKAYEEVRNVYHESPIDETVQKPTKIKKKTGLSSNTLLNGKALSRYEVTYELEKFKKNALIIFNHEDIDDLDEPRTGTHLDVEALTNTFENLGFEVKENIHHDLRKKEIISKVTEFTSRDFTEYGCIGIVILTHGDDNGRLWAKDRSYSELDIIEHLKLDNRTLMTKPKLVIIQACRGGDVKPPVPVFHSGIISTESDIDLEPYHSFYNLPLDADMLVLHSCYDGSPAFRDLDKGSWFIQTLCETIEQLAPAHDLETIITEVKRRVAIDKYQQERENVPDEYQMCQMPVVTSTLLRKLYLNKFGDGSPAYKRSVLPVVAGDQNLLTRQTSLLLMESFSQHSHLSTTTHEPCSCFLGCLKSVYEGLLKAFR